MKEFDSALPLAAAVEAIQPDLGTSVAEESVILANTAVALALGESAWRGRDVDMSVSPGAYGYLRDQPGWEETQLPNGGCHITNGTYNIVIGWNGGSHAALQARSWQTEGGLNVAGLPDVYATKQARGLAKDERDTALIRARLQSPGDALPIHLMPSELELVRACLPEHLQDDPVAVRLIAENVLTDFTLYGDPRIGRWNQIVGDLELPEYGVPAAYHNGFDIIDELARVGRRFASIELADQAAGRKPTFSRKDQYDALIAHSGADAVYGYGRHSDNPSAYDELRSANRLYSRACSLGYSALRATRLHTLVENTSFNEKTGQQKGQRHPDPVVREVVGTDLRVTSEPDSVEQLFRLVFEDGFSARFSKARILGRVAAEHGVRISSIDEAVAFADRYADIAPSDMPGRQTVREMVASRLIGNAAFHDPDKGYQAPYGYPVHREMRLAHAAVVQVIGHRLASKAVTFAEVAAEVAEHTYNMRKQFGDEHDMADVLPAGPVLPLY